MELQMTAPCLLGLEGLVAEELRQMDAREVTAENGRVFFNGDQAMLARANINSRFAERILIVLDRFTAVTFEELFQIALERVYLQYRHISGERVLYFLYPAQCAGLPKNHQKSCGRESERGLPHQLV